MKGPQYVVRSNVHMMNLDTAINRLLGRERFIDVTLACDGHKFHCHRLVLAASSPLFEELLIENPTKHPIVILPVGIKSHTLKSLIDFIYKGQTNVSQNGLKDLVESAQLLQVTGLQDAETHCREIYDEDEDDDMDQDEDNQEQQEPTEQEGHREQQQTNRQEDIANKSDSINVDEQRPKERIVDFIEIEDSLDAPIVIEEDVPAAETNATETPKNTENSDNTTNNDATSVNPATDPNAQFITVINNDENGKVTEETKLLQPCTSPTMPKLTTCIPTIRVKPSIKLINLFQLTGRPGQSGNGLPPDKIPWTYIHIPASSSKGKNKIQSPSTQVPLRTRRDPWTSNPLGWTNSPQPSTSVSSGATSTTAASTLDTTTCTTTATTTATTASISVPSFLKFNSRSMAISVKNLDRTDKQEKVKVVNMAMEAEPEVEREVMEVEREVIEVTQEQQSTEVQLKNEYETPAESNEIELGETLLSEADFPMFYAMLKKEKEEKAAQLAKEKQKKQADAIAEAEAEAEAETEAENIICQPNVSYIYGGYDDETYGYEEDEHLELLQQQQQQQQEQGKSKRQKNKRQLKPKKTDESSLKYLTPGLLPVPKSHRLKHPPTLVPLSVMHAGMGSKHFYYHHKLTTAENGKIVFSKEHSVFNTISNSPPRIGGETHSPQTVILRNPRCNQPRHYSTDSLYNALMAVKYGESIYRASRQHQVPRKTLRNWMKRWDIKSQFPMPKQLKDAAKKKKQTETT